MCINKTSHPCAVHHIIAIRGYNTTMVADSGREREIDFRGQREGEHRCSKDTGELTNYVAYTEMHSVARGWHSWLK